MKKVKLLIIANNSPWLSKTDTNLKKALDFWMSKSPLTQHIPQKVEFTSVEVISRDFKDVPFVPVSESQFIPNETWEYNAIRPLKGNGYDVVVILFNSKDWKGGTAGGWHRNGYVYLQADYTQSLYGEDAFYGRLRHELGHYLAYVFGVPDYTHTYDGDSLYKCLELFPAEDSKEQKITLIKQALVAAQSLLAILLAKQKAQVSLYDAAVKCLGTDASPSDLAPDSYGCAESVSTIIHSIDSKFPIVTGTWSLWDALRASKSFVKVSEPIKGDIILCVTGQGKHADVIPNGHVGIVGENGKIMSNDSATGLFLENYTLDSWKARYVDKGGYPIYIFRRI